MRNISLALFTSFALSACTITESQAPGDLEDDKSDDTDSAENFVGSYRTTITVSGAGSQTFTDSLAINTGTTSDLVLASQQLGSLKATIISDSAFSIDQQQILLTDANGQSFSVTIDGQGTVNGGVFNANGTLSSVNGAFSYTIAGSRL